MAGMGMANGISWGYKGLVYCILICQSIPTYLDGSNVSGLGGAGHRVPAHHAHSLQRRGEVKPLEYLQSRVFSLTRYYSLALEVYPFKSQFLLFSIYGFP